LGIEKFKYLLYVYIRMVSGKIKKGNSKLTLSINKKILEKYKKYCKEEGIIISKQVEKFMKKRLSKK